MPKIIFDEQQDTLPYQEAPKVMQRRGGQFIVIFLILAFVMGGIGGAGSLILLSENTRVRQYLGITENSPLNLTRTTTEKLVVEESNAFIETVKDVSPSVVSVAVKREGVDFLGRVISQEGAGTGFIITSDGLIVTNKHVVSSDSATYTVVTTDGKSYDAKVQARDPFNDLAILKIEATGLPVIDLGDSDGVEVGQWVIAIGNAFGEFNNSVSVGVVSAKNRKLSTEGSQELTGLLQTDAAINPGNSGGPLVNIKGQVVGINTAIASTTGESSGVGFAIPINAVKKAIDSVRKTGTIQRPMLGVRYVNIDKSVSEQLRLTVDHGALVRGTDAAPGVVADGPADKAGLQENDIILELNGERIDEDHQLANLLVKYSPNEEVSLKILRAGKEMNIKVILGELK
jgi:serine protease Do